MRTPQSHTHRDEASCTDGQRIAAEFLDAWIPDPERAQRVKTIVAIYRARDEAAEQQAERAQRRRHVADAIVAAVMLLAGLIVSRLLYRWGYPGPARLLTATTAFCLLLWVSLELPLKPRKAPFRDR